MPPTSSIPARRSRPARQRRDLLPDHVDPMLAILGELPRNPNRWAFEYKWDGVRAITYFDGHKLRIDSRNLLDITHRYPELHALADALNGRRAILDGEIVALDDAGRPSFTRLQRRMHINDTRAIAHQVKATPIWYVLFDVLHLDGRSLMDRPYVERREILEELTVVGPHWQVTPSHVNQGEQMLAAARQNQLEGLVAKRIDSTYEPGRRSPQWLKIKIIQRQEFVVGGWIPEHGTSPSDKRIGAMLIGYHDCDGRLHFAGAVGSGLVGSDHAMLTRQFRSRSNSPFAQKIPKKGVIFIEPRPVIEVEYRRWPEGGMVQQAAYKGLRTDKDPSTIVKEPTTR